LLVISAPVDGDPLPPGVVTERAPFVDDAARSRACARWVAPPDVIRIEQGVAPPV